MQNYGSDSITKYLFVLNSQKKRGLVILVPITRIGTNAVKKWIEIIGTVNSSEVQSLVILDKTPNQEASKYFKKLSDSINAELIILVRPPTEQYFDSMKYVRLDEQLWILQLHDDDAWEGRLKIPDQLGQQRIFLSSFISVNEDEITAITDTQSFPQRVIFSCLPARIWNRFIDFIECQGGHTAGSADSTLALVAYTSSEIELNVDFTYYYSTGNWDNRKSARKHLTKLCQDDGWESLSSPRIAVMNRCIDNITGLVFFREYIQRDVFQKSVDSQIYSLRLGKKKKVLFKCLVSVLNYFISPILDVLSLIALGSLRHRIQSLNLLTHNILSQFQIILILDEIRNPQELLGFIERDLQDLNLSKLKVRFDFWVSQMSIYVSLIKN